MAIRMRAHRRAPNQRDLNMVFQNYALFPHYQVFDNVAYGLKVRKTPAAETHERVIVPSAMRPWLRC